MDARIPLYATKQIKKTYRIGSCVDGCSSGRLLKINELMLIKTYKFTLLFNEFLDTMRKIL